MNSRLPTIVLLIASLLLAACVGGCASINEKAAAAIGDYVPQWAGGLPADAPPRPGTAKYDAWMRERERQRLLPADQRDKDAGAAGATSGSQSSSTAATPPGLDPVH